MLNSSLVKVLESGLPFISLSIVEKTGQKPNLEDSVLLVNQVAYLESTRQFVENHKKISNSENGGIG
ncbi:hypothetical protein [Zarconia navalis]|uniref:hypothetical protein n=1 Tax=Zarconia navalis TaxID=2992134 RepID=UPI00386913BF